MPKLSEQDILERDAKRDLNTELLESLEQLKRGEVGRVLVQNEGRFVESAIARVRLSTGMSQNKFAEMLGVSKRTIQEWEQGRRKPTAGSVEEPPKMPNLS